MRPSGLGCHDFGGRSLCHWSIKPRFEPHRIPPWTMYAFDTTEKAHIGRRSREWTVVGQTEVESIREMARCLREINAGRVPK